MKIIATDNQNREHVSEYVVAENVNAYYGQLIRDFLNDKLCSSDNALHFYKLELDEYEPYTFEP